MVSTRKSPAFPRHQSAVFREKTSTRPPQHIPRCHAEYGKQSCCSILSAPSRNGLGLGAGLGWAVQRYLNPRVAWRAWLFCVSGHAPSANLLSGGPGAAAQRWPSPAWAPRHGLDLGSALSCRPPPGPPGTSSALLPGASWTAASLTLRCGCSSSRPFGAAPPAATG